MKRLRLPDLLKGIAILFMIQVHIMELFIDFPGRESMVGKISLFAGGPFTAMVFMIVMGYFIASSKKTLIQNLMRGAKIFALGFLLNIGLNFHLLFKIAFHDWPYNPMEYIFGVDILYLAGLSIILLSVMKSIPKFQILLVGAVLLLVIFSSEHVNRMLTFTERNYITPFIGGYYSWSYFPLFPWLAYPLAGYFFYLVEDKIGTFLTNYKILASSGVLGLLLLVIIFRKFGFLITVDLPQYYHHGFKYSLWALSLVIVWIFFLRIVTKQTSTSKIEQFLAWMGKNITLVYAIQWLIIGNIATAIFQTQALKMFPIWFAGVLAATIILTWLTKKTKLKI
jgi:uncharacterized membrane protein